MSKTRRSKRWGAGELAVVTLALAIAAFERTGTVAADEPGEIEVAAPRYPAVLRGQLAFNLGGAYEVVLEAQELGGVTTSATLSAPVSPVSIDLAVEGGDASSPVGNPGVDYLPRFTLRIGSVKDPHVVQIVRTTPVRVRNTVPGVPHVETVVFPPSTTNRIAKPVHVSGGTLRLVHLVASTTRSGYFYASQGSTEFRPLRGVASGEAVLAAPALSGVTLAGYALVDSFAGTLIRRDLPPQAIDASAPVTLSPWMINL